MTTISMTADTGVPEQGGIPEQVDVLVVGAGISGVGAAYHFSTQMPDATVAVVDDHDTFGGTWTTHTYPGIRSDSDLYTFGYRFKPWTGTPIATAEEILKYMGEVIEENHLEPLIHYGHRVTTAEWSSTARRWTIEIVNEGTTLTVSARFLFMCQGYYRHSKGYTPTWEGMDDFEGTIVHPQTWPEDLDYTDKQVVVIGSGATAATLVPAMAPDVARITMLQRSPTYFRAGRNVNELADQLREVDIDEEWIHEIVRRRALFEQDRFSRMCVEKPDLVMAELLSDVRARLAPEHEHLVEEAFTPSYRPWQQRLAFVPDGDLFEGINSGKATVVTGDIDRFTADGIALSDGRHLDADIIVTATGFDLNVLGDVAFTIDGEPLDFSETVTYRGLMFTGVPNLAWVFGYFRASWTLRSDLIADFVIRLLQHMSDISADMVVPQLGPDEADMERRPWVDPDNFNPGYLQRGMHLLPKQGTHQPWLHTQDYWTEKDELPAVDLDEPALHYTLSATSNWDAPQHHELVDGAPPVAL